MAPSLVAGFTNSHICCSFPRAFLHAPAANLGAGVPNIFTIQGIKHLEFMMSAGQSSSLTGKLIRASFEAFLTECWVDRMVCNPKWSELVRGTTLSWIRETTLFLQINKLELRHDIDIHTLCNTNIFLIAYWSTQNAKEATLMRLDRCRLYMELAKLSEMVSGNDKIHPPTLVHG
jgi:hypothetical protein